jgi:hypothetical protein
MTVRSGAFCAPPGETGETVKGTGMVCGPAAGGRNRWASVAGPSARRRLLDKARKAGVGKIKRNMPDAEIEQMIAAVQAPAPAPEPVLTEADYADMDEAEDLRQVEQELATPETELEAMAVDGIRVLNDGRRGGYIKLADLRERLGNPDLEVFHQTLRNLSAAGTIDLEEEPMRWRITDRDRASWIRHGGADLDMVALREPASVGAGN